MAKAKPRGHPPALTIYLTARDVLFDPDAGRLKLTRNLKAGQTQFWLEIEQERQFERYLHIEQTNRPLLQVLHHFDIGGNDWRLELLPPRNWLWRFGP